MWEHIEKRISSSGAIQMAGYCDDSGDESDCSVLLLVPCLACSHGLMHWLLLLLLCTLLCDLLGRKPIDVMRSSELEQMVDRLRVDMELKTTLCVCRSVMFLLE